MDDGDNYKKNCQKRHKNKGRYKDKSKVIPKTTTAAVPKETKLDSNWDRYDRQIVDEAEPSSKTFSLKGEPVARGGLFIAKSDRYLFPADGERPQSDEMFRLDVNAIGAAICTLPFYLRVGIDPHVFTEDEIAQMDQEVAPIPVGEPKTFEEVEPKPVDEETHEANLTRDLEEWLSDVLN